MTCTACSDDVQHLKLCMANLMLFLCLACFPQSSQAAWPVEVKIEGVDGDARKNVEAAIALPSSFIRDGKVDRHWLEHYTRQAEGNVKAALEPFGYYTAEASATLEGDAKVGYILKVKVTPGNQARLTGTELDLQGPGAGELLLKAKLDAFPLHKGDHLLHEPYETAKADILTTARELGYLDADFPVHEIRVDPATASAQIQLVLNTGPRYQFGETSIKGASYYSENLLKRYIPFSAGQPFSYKALAQTQVNFSSSPYFKSVSIITDKEDAEECRVPVTIQVSPAPRRTIRPGIGYGTDTGFRGSVNYRDLSLLYPGHTFNADATIAERLQGISLIYSIPGSRNLDTMTSLQLNLQREPLNDTLSSLAALELSHTVGFSGNQQGTVFVRFMYERYRAGLDDSSAMLPLPGLRFSQRSYDDPIRPTQGFHYGLETRGTVRALGADASFAQFIAEGGGMIALPWRLSLLGRVKGGATILDDPFVRLPLSLRFFAGGDTSVRGYAYKSLGPRDTSGAVVGGKHLLQGSTELQRTFFDNWAGSLFYDFGNAFDTFNNLHIYQGAGIGLHYYTPVGGINLWLARQLGLREPEYRVHFSIGFQL